MRELAINKSNYDRYNSVTDVHSYDGRKALEIMCDVNRLLDEELGGNEDWGGKYATWLDKLGVESNSDNGWWSKAAIDPDNIQYFISAMKNEDEEGIFDKCQETKGKIAEIRKLGHFKSKFRKVSELVEAATQQTTLDVFEQMGIGKLPIFPTPSTAYNSNEQNGQTAKN